MKISPQRKMALCYDNDFKLPTWRTNGYETRWPPVAVKSNNATKNNSNMRHVVKRRVLQEG